MCRCVLKDTRTGRKEIPSKKPIRKLRLYNLKTSGSRRREIQKSFEKEFSLTQIYQSRFNAKNRLFSGLAPAMTENKAGRHSVFLHARGDKIFLNMERKLTFLPNRSITNRLSNALFHDVSYIIRASSYPCP